jgi:carbamoyltransferase
LLELLTGERELHKPSFFVKSFKNGYEYNDCGYYVNINNLEPLKENEIEMVKESTIIDFDHFLRLQSTIYKFVQDRLGPDYNKDDILDYLEGNKEIPPTMKTTPWELAYTVQYFAEQVILNWLSLVEGTNPEGNNNILFAAGGLLANVKLNQKIKDTGKFKKVFISPPMGDEGTALGVVYDLASVEFVDKYNNFGPDLIINGGTHINHDGSLAAVLREAKENPRLQVLSFENDEDGLVEKITDLLASEKIVHVCRNREEFGPRALMNHSTLYTAQDPNGTHTLNQAMGRSEYMPYCPVCKNTSADKLFKDYKVGEESCRFMAMTMDCLPGVKEKYRGGVHVDNTARAQFIYEEDEGTKFAWKLLDSYEKKTGNLMMINTSFNVHNTPTCNLASDCWEAWKYSDFVGAALVLQDHIIIKKFSGQLDLEK